MPRFSAATFRTLGNAATAQTLLTIENTTGSAINVQIRRLVMQMDATAVLTTFMPLIKTSRCAVPSGGTVLTKTPYDTSLAASAANVVVRGATASDGGGATAITATPGNLLWEQMGMRLHTAVGQVLGLDNNQLPLIIETTPVVLNPNEAIMVHVVAAATTSNPNTNHYFIQVAWDEV